MTNDPASLTRDELGHFRQLLADGRISKAYDELAARGYRYARLANGVVKGDTFSGRIALEFLQKTAEDEEHPLSSADIDAIRMDMAKVYLDALSLQLSGPAQRVTRDVLADEAWKFHAGVFQDHGLDPDAWTLNTPYTLMEADARQVYWAAVLDSAGNFAKELMLGLATDFIMKRAALDLLAPVEKEEAWRWLHRLHNLDTYLAAGEAAGAQLDRLASDLPAVVAGKTRNGLNAAAIKAILERADHAALDEALKTQLSDLGAWLSPS